MIVKNRLENVITIYISFSLIIFSNILLSTPKQDPSVVTNIIDRIKQQKTSEKDLVKIKTVSISEQEYMQAHEEYIQQLAESQPTSMQKKTSLPKPEEWILKSSFNNAPKLLKGIFVYLQSYARNHNNRFSIIPSFHRFILVGPPGSGKTTLAHAIAHLLGYSVIFIPATYFLGRYRNHTSDNITQFLKEYALTQFKVVIIIDELHKLFEHSEDDQSDHSQSAAAFWLGLDEIEKRNPNTIIIGTANTVNKLPPEIKSRFSGKIITLSLPDKKQKLHAFKNTITYDNSIILSNSIDDAFIGEMLQKINNCSLRSVRLIIDTAKMFYYAEKPFEENIFPIVLTKKHFRQALEQLQTESEILQTNIIDRFYKQLHPWGLFFSVAVNISLLLKTSTEFYDKVVCFY